MNFTTEGREEAYKAMQKSPKFTRAQRVRKKFMMRRPLEKDRVLTPFHAVLQTCIMADEVQTEMLEHKLDLKKYRLFCALVVRTRKDKLIAVSTHPVQPEADSISAVMAELKELKDPQPLGVIFRIVDWDVTPVTGRDWVRQFIAGDKAFTQLMGALTAQGLPGGGSN
jgi:hypothetical protein